MRLAIVGAGQISHRFLKQAIGSERARFVATCARTTSSAHARAVEYGIDAWFDDYTAMYDAVSPDGVVVATRPPQHAAPAIAALDRGIHVLCEKPMAATMEDCYAMVGAAKRSGAVLLCLPYEAWPAHNVARRYLNEAILGVCTGAEAQVLLPGVSREQWHDREAWGGGVVLDALVYPVSMLVNVLGPACRVTGVVNTLIPRRILSNKDTAKAVDSTVDDNATLVVEWTSGQQAVIRGLWATSIARYDHTIYGRHGTLWISGNKVIVHAPRAAIPGAARVLWHGHENCYDVPVEVPENEGLMDHFVACIDRRERPNCSAEQQLHVHEILFKGYESARSGRAQDLKTTFTPMHQTDPGFMDARSRPI